MIRVIISVPKADPAVSAYRRFAQKKGIVVEESKNFLLVPLLPVDEYSFKIPSFFTSIKKPYFIVEAKEATFAHGACVVCKSDGGKLYYHKKFSNGNADYRIRGGSFASIFLFRRDQTLSIKGYFLEQFGDSVFLQEKNIWCGVKREFPVRLITFSNAIEAAVLKLSRPVTFGCECPRVRK